MNKKWFLAALLVFLNPSLGFSGPLHDAVREDNKERVAVLLAEGAEINEQDEDDNTPLHLAARRTRRVRDGELGRLISVPASNYSARIRTLLQSGARVNIRNAEGETPLNIAVSLGHIPGIEMLAQALIVENAVNTRDQDDNTPLHTVAGLLGSVDIVRALLAAGAQSNAQNEALNTALHLAAHNGDVATVRVLLAAGALPNIQNEEGETPLHSAAREDRRMRRVNPAEDRSATVLALIDAGASLALQNQEGETPLEVASDEAKEAMQEWQQDVQQRQVNEVLAMPFHPNLEQLDSFQDPLRAYFLRMGLKDPVWCRFALCALLRNGVLFQAVLPPDVINKILSFFNVGDLCEAPKFQKQFDNNDDSDDEGPEGFGNGALRALTSSLSAFPNH